MTEGPIPFRNLQDSGDDVLAGGSPIAANVVSTRRGGVRRRPGVTAYSGAPSTAIHSGSIVCLHETFDSRLFAVGDSPVARSIYKVQAGGVTTLMALEPFGLAGVPGSGRPQSEETEMLLVFAGGKNLTAVRLSSELVFALSNDAPMASHITANGLRLIANDLEEDRNRVRYSDVSYGDLTFAGHTTWTEGVGTAGSFSAEASPDPVLAVGATVNEVYLFGSTTTQIYAKDPVLVFGPVATIEVGISAPHSAIKHDQLFYWIDDRRRVVVGENAAARVLSAPIQQTLDDLIAVDDAWGFVFEERGTVCLCWIFPSDGLTFSYQPGVGWSEWLGWDAARANWKAMAISAHTKRRGSPQNLVGTTAGLVGRLTMSSETDSGDAVRAYIQTGSIDRGTLGRKHCQAVRFKLRRGHTLSSQEPHARFGYRDAPNRPWREYPIRLGATSESDPVVSFSSLGTYESREWFFEFSGPEELELVQATETYTNVE